MSSRGLELLLRVFPQAPGADEVRHRFVAIAVSLAVGVAAVTAPIYRLSNPALAAVTAAFGAVAVLLGLVLRVTRNAPLVFWSLQVAVALLFLNARWTDSTLDASLAMWLAVLPLTAMLYGGTRAGLVASGLAVATTVAIIFAPNPGWYGAFPLSSLGALTRVLSFFVATFVLSAAWQGLRAEALARAEAAARARTLFLAKMSHELRTPLNGVMGLTDLLLASEPRPDQRASLELMRRSGDHLLRLIEEVIDFARLEADRMPLASEPVDLELLVRDVVELLRPAAQSASLELVAEVEPGTPRWVLGDQRRLRQVLMNLAGNAVKFTLRGSVGVTVGYAGGRHVFTVRDTGVGIDGAMLERLFQPFEQAEAEANRRFGGSGLGLAVTRRLVERMGGTLSVESQPGVGSTFTVALPLTPTEARPAKPDDGPVLLAPGATRRLLIVDDNELNLHVATALVRRLGHEATACHSAQEALDALQAGSFDAVLMDCHMPGLDGFEATQRIRQLRAPLSRIPIIALTASALPEELARCLKAGMNDYITKPVTLDALKAAIDRVLSAPPQAPSAGSGEGKA